VYHSERVKIDIGLYGLLVKNDKNIFNIIYGIISNIYPKLTLNPIRRTIYTTTNVDTAYLVYISIIIFSVFF
jgi:uncharacterized protein YggT (Ycf19 family)